jgi:hypothetical protein
VLKTHYILFMKNFLFCAVLFSALFITACGGDSNITPRQNFVVGAYLPEEGGVVTYVSANGDTAVIAPAVRYAGVWEPRNNWNGFQTWTVATQIVDTCTYAHHDDWVLPTNHSFDCSYQFYSNGSTEAVWSDKANRKVTIGACLGYSTAYNPASKQDFVPVRVIVQ